MVEVETGVSHPAIQSVVFILEFPACDRGRDFVESIRIEAQRFSHFASRALTAIGDDIGGHCCSALTVALIKILNDTLPFVAAGEVKVDVGPLAAFFRKEPLKE